MFTAVRGGDSLLVIPGRKTGSQKAGHHSLKLLRMPSTQNPQTAKAINSLHVTSSIF